MAFAAEVKRVYGTAFDEMILYGSCAWGDFEADSDIDILILLDVPREAISHEQSKIFPISDKLDWEYDVVLTPVLQSSQVYRKYKNVSCFYQNIEKEGVKIAWGSWRTAGLCEI